jgi:aminoglycoside/choline kinase family phosphotransferase
MTLGKKLLRAANHLAGATSPIAGGEPDSVIPLTGGGSDRNFYRFKYNSDSVVVLVQPGGGPEFELYVRIGNLLRRQDIGVPEFFGVDSDRGILVMEDLGDLSLQDVLSQCNHRREKQLYSQCIKILIKFQTTVTIEMQRRKLLADRFFNFHTLMDETEYFRREFIEKFCPVELEENWNEERERLARILSGMPPVFMHRDFQSKNIILKEGKIRIIDFQSAYRGPGIYDAAALLKDPYHPISAKDRVEMLNKLYAILYQQDLYHQDFPHFHRIFTYAGIQRNLQALAAFTKLGLIKKKRNFLRYIPAGLELLQEGIKEAGDLPSMESMVQRIKLHLKSTGFYSSITL